MADQVTLPDGQEFFKLNEVCKIANVQPYMLRFWGTEFSQLEAAKSGTGQRMYSRDQVQVILEIRRLLFDEGLTIAGARKRIGALQEDGKLPTPEVPVIPEEVPPPAKKRSAEEAPAAEAPAPQPVEAERKAAPAEKAPAAARPAPAPARAAAAKVDKAASDRVQPLLATLKDVRTEVAKIVADLKAKA